MKLLTLPLLALLATLSFATALVAPAVSQTNEAVATEEETSGEDAEGEETEETEELDPADANAAPFPPGRHAAITKQVCTGCHMANMVLQRTYTYDEAVRFYEIMVTSNTDTDEARAIIEYLSTTLAP